MATLTLYTPAELVFVSWISSIPGLTANGVATQLPANEKSWAASGFVVVPVTVGGSPHMYMAVHRPVGQVECWATNPNSDKLPWAKANQLVEQIYRGTLDRRFFGRALNITAGGVAYPTATVKAATMLTEARRIWSDVGDYAGFTFDLQLEYVQQGDTTP